MAALLLLKRAEELMGPNEYDPLLLLTLCMEDDVLRAHTCYGERMLELLGPLLSESGETRQMLLEEARACVQSPRGFVCMELLRRVVGLTREPNTQSQSKKDKLLESFVQEAVKQEKRRMVYPSLLQVVYKSGARKHFLADRWMDALHAEMQDLLLRCRSKEDEEWMSELCQKVLGLNWRRQIHCRKGTKAGSGPMQVIEFPNALQRTLKLYVDWDKKLSDVRARSNFLGAAAAAAACAAASADDDGLVQRRSDVEKIRQLAMGTPAAIVRLLKRMGCMICISGNPQNSVRVIVKEGTRPLHCSSLQQQDWKISFHFVFQIVVSSAQFRLIYHHLADLIRTQLENLAAALCLTAGHEEGVDDDNRRRKMETDAMLDPLHGALVGMDLHPRQNVYQGLACLGSKKSDDAPRSRYVGAMEVDVETCMWQWCSSSSRGGGACCSSSSNSDDTNDSVASTVVCSAEEEEEEEDHHLVQFNRLVQKWLECSVLMPSASCCSLVLPKEWMKQLQQQVQALLEHANAASTAAGFPLAGTMQRVKHLDDAVSRMVLPPRAAAAAAARPPASAAASRSSNPADQLWKRLLFEGRGLQWMREALGGDEAIRKMFANAYLNIQSISKPAEVAEAASKKKGSGSCPPWALVQVAESDCCACCLSLMRVPFKGFKRHSRNGVVFCFFGDRVFVTCMDDECRGILRHQSKTFFSLAREAEQIHLGRYDHLITRDRDEFVPSIVAHSEFAEWLHAHHPLQMELLQREAHKRWNRVMMQCDAANIMHWTQQQVQRIREGLQVTASYEADEGSAADLLLFRKTPSRCMCVSASEDRTWVELREETLKEYASWLSKKETAAAPPPGSSSSRHKEQKKQPEKMKKNALKCSSRSDNDALKCSSRSDNDEKQPKKLRKVNVV